MVATGRGEKLGLNIFFIKFFRTNLGTELWNKRSVQNERPLRLCYNAIFFLLLKQKHLLFFLVII